MPLPVIDLTDYGYDEAFYAPDGLAAERKPGELPARIVDIRRGRYGAVCAFGEVPAILGGTFLREAESQGGPAVGDFVRLRYNAAGDSAITSLLRRKSKFSRADFSGHAVGYVKTIREQVVAANFDYVFVLSSLNRDFNLNRILRYTTAARQSGGVPVVVLTKADLCDNLNDYLQAFQENDGGVDAVAVSSHTGVGLDRLSAYLTPGKTAALLGMSGVGKSSLINALAGKMLMAVSEVRASDARGRHTTTHRQLIRLPSGAMLIDTPGMRELGLWDASDGISSAFAEVEALFVNCRFSNCRHETEPGCAVRAALTDGSLSADRWASYLSFRQEAGFVKSKQPHKRRPKG